MAYSLTRSDINGGSAVDLGTITAERPTKTSGIILTPEPLGNSTETRGIDFAGTTLRIKLSGAIVNATLATLATKATNLFAFVNGDQVTTATYVSDILGTLNVKVLSVDGEFEGGNPTIYSYNMELVQTSTDI